MLHEILKDFPGSQDGRITEQFKAGTQVELSAYLAGIVVPEGWAKPVGAVEIQNKAIIAAPSVAEAEDKPRRGRRSNK